MTSGVRVRFFDWARSRPLQLLTLMALVAGSAAAAAPVTETLAAHRQAAAERRAEALAARQPERLVWRGADVDGDGRADFANPTGHAPRGHDYYGEGEFGASRDGGSRRHEGVDFKAVAGQAVRAPMSGYVTKIGYAYPGDETLKFVEITNPALHYEARVFYVDPAVQVGDPVAIGHVIGTAHSLQRRYPDGMTNHIHLELIDRRGDHLDAERLIVARYEPAPADEAMGD